MKVSVITPSFNSSKTIGRNIESVNQQTHPDLEHIFVDNLSSDDTLKIVRESAHRVTKIISEPDRGISDAFNKGIRNSTGEIIAILNSDDSFFDSTALCRVHQAFVANPEVQFVYGNMLFVDPVFGTNMRKPLECPVTKAMPFNHPAFFVRSSFYEKVGLFDENFKVAMDFELISRMYKAPNKPELEGIYLKGQPLAVMYAGGISWNHEEKSLSEVERALKKNGLWNGDANRQLFIRRYRVKMKGLLNTFGLQCLVRAWRTVKWKA